MSGESGRVYLVGAGPGAHDLITLRGLRCLERADVVLYDELSNLALQELAAGAPEWIPVGKRGGQKTMEQEAICALMIERAKLGECVVRLKGGDPFVFGRGGEEAEALALAKIPYEIVPGVTAAVAVPAFAGIPITQRGLADGFEVLTGHAAGELRPSTAVVLMGMSRLGENVERLRRRGYGGELPAAVIEWGTLPRQRTAVATLDTIVEAASHIGSPAVLVVGTVVAMHERLRWFETLPLFGRRVLVTRSRRQAADTCRLLEELGAEVVAMPTIDIRPPRDLEPLRRAVREVGRYDLVVLTSANAVAPLASTLAEAGLDSRAFAGARICAIGPGTADALGKVGLRPDLVPADHSAEGILELLSGEPIAGKRVLLPRAAVARQILPSTLAARGAEVDVVPVYETVLPSPERTRAGIEALERGLVDVLTFTSASTAENFAAIVGVRLAELCAGKVVAAIGPITREACQRSGLTVQIMPRRYTLPALVEAIVEHFVAGR